MKPVNTKLRSINTKFWDDSYVIDLSPLEKYLFLYLLTNIHTNLAGVYEITSKKIAFDTGLEKIEIEKILKKFSDDKKIIYQDGFIIIKNYLKNQSFNSSMIKNVEKTINQLPPNIKNTFLAFVNPSKILNSLSTASNILSTACDSVRQIENENEIEKEREGEKEGEGGRKKEKPKDNKKNFCIDPELKKKLEQIENKYNKPLARPVR